MQKIKYQINAVSIFQNHDLLVKEKSISNKWKKSIAKTILLQIYLIWYRYAFVGLFTVYFIFLEKYLCNKYSLFIYIYIYIYICIYIYIYVLV